MFIYIAAPRRATKTTTDECTPGPCEAGNDPRQFPILSRHWGDLHPAEIVSDLRFHRQVERVHALGARVTAELLAEIGAERGIQTIIDQKLATYAKVDPGMIEAVGGDDFWPVPLHEVRGT